MRVEVLLSALEYDFNNLNTFNLESDLLIINQTNKNSYVEMDKDGYKVRVVNTTERGIGSSRKKAVEKSNGDFLIFIDDDETLVENYAKLIKEEYKKNTTYDLLFFKIIRNGIPERNKNYPKKNEKINYLNSLKYGAVNITVKKKSLEIYDHNFSSKFGNSNMSHGEDTVFIFSALKKGMKLKYINKILGSVEMENSTWFTGINEKYLMEKGYLFYELSNHFSLLLIIQYLLRKKEYKLASFTTKEAFILMNEGRKCNKHAREIVVK